MIDYDHGIRISAEVWELSPLDLSIQQYETRCRDYHYRKIKKPNETQEARTDRLNKLKENKAYLDLEKNRIMSMIFLDGPLELYRSEHKQLAKKAKRQKYKEEEHHPTAVLEGNLRLAGRAKPSPRFTAHHLVEGQGKLPVTKQARLLLARYDIRINDPDNGVWMPISECDRGHWAMPKATPHSQIHTHNYERWVFGQVQLLQSEKEIRQKLSILRAHLKNGTQPDKVTTKSDKRWDGRRDI